MYGPTHQVRSPLRGTDGQVHFTDWASILSCWSEHSQSLFCTDHFVQDPTVLRIHQQPFKAELDELPAMKEITKAIEHLRSVKAAGVDAIPPDLWKEGGTALHSKLHELLVCCWEQGKHPSDLRYAITVTLYKNKGEKSALHRRKSPCSCTPK